MVAMAGTAANTEGKSYFKGQKMSMTSGDVTTVMDFGAQTVTIINNGQKTYKVQKFGEMTGPGANMDVTADVKQTGQKKTINGGFPIAERDAGDDGHGSRNGPRQRDEDAG